MFVVYDTHLAKRELNPLGMIRLWGDPMDLYPLRSLGLPKGEQFIERLWVPTVALDYYVGLFLRKF